MPAYDERLFSPPAPLSKVSLRNQDHSGRLSWDRRSRVALTGQRNPFLYYMPSYGFFSGWAMSSSCVSLMRTGHV